VVGILSARRENKIGHIFSILAGLTEIALVSLALEASFESVFYFVGTRTAIYGGLAALLEAVTTILARLRLRGFNKGLRPLLERGRVHHGTLIGERVWSAPTALQPLRRPRMEIE